MIAGRSLQKSYRAQDGKPHPVLSDVQFEIGEGEFYVLLGPSGSGKTTTLRAIAGLEHPDTGEIVMDGRAVFDSNRRIKVPPEQRPIAMVFQSYALWPHMNVFENIAFPLRHGVRRVEAQQVQGRVEHAAELLNLGPYLTRSVSQLSGGQQQRVALARTIALHPRVLLMDEPLSNLDAKLRARLRVELKTLTRSIGMTTIYVTHDQEEAMVMADRIAVMDGGRILQEGTPAELYQQPRETFVARFLGEMNFMRARLGRVDVPYCVAHLPDAELRAVCHGDVLAPGADVSIGFRPEDASLRVGPCDANGFNATVTNRYYLGDCNLYQLEAHGQALQVRAPKAQCFDPGSRVFVELEPQACLTFKEET